MVLFLQDFDNLVSEIRKRNMKLVLDFIPSHSSDQHQWFQESRKGGADNPYKDYYVWEDGKKNEEGDTIPPSNKVGCCKGIQLECMKV